MNIATRTPSSTPSDSFAPYSADAVAAGLIAQCSENAADARADRHSATERRFEAAEDSIEHARDAARCSFVGAMLGHTASIAQGAASVASVAARARDAEGASSEGDSGGSGAPSAAELKSGRIEAWGGVANSSLGIGKTVAEMYASRADSASQSSKLESERAQERASVAGETAQRETSVRDQLTRQLEEMARQRHQLDERAVGQR